MSYLRQVKRKRTDNLILNVSSIIMTIATLSIFTNNSFGIMLNNFRFQIYIITAILLIFSLYKKSFLHIVFFVILSFTNYSAISAYSNIFKNKKIEAKQEILIKYNKKNSSDLEFITKNKQAIVLINFSKSTNLKESLAILESFVLSNNSSIIIIGDFGLPLWHPEIKSLMQKTGLSAKNKLIFDKLSPFYIPTINVLGFDNIGIKKIIKKNDDYKFILLAK